MAVDVLDSIGVIALLLFFFGVYLRISIWFKGKNTSEMNDHSLRESFVRALKEDTGLILKIIVFESLFQKRLFSISKIRWTGHMFIFFGFIGKILVHWGSWRWSLDFLNEIFGFLIFVGILMAVIRRSYVKDRSVVTNLEDGIAVGFLLIVLVSGFLLEGLRMGSFEPESFFGSIIGVSIADSLDYGTMWFIHGVISYAFIAYIPYGKLFHIIASPVTAGWTAYREAKEYGVIS
jgi:nitrate reductase gamma subunit